jgi:hypothetical protein
MKRKIRIILISAFFVTASFLTMAQTPPHPNNGANPGIGNGPVGGGAPIGSGLCILLAMGLAYGASKLFNDANEDPVQE